MPNRRRKGPVQTGKSKKVTSENLKIDAAAKDGSVVATRPKCQTRLSKQCSPSVSRDRQKEKETIAGQSNATGNSVGEIVDKPANAELSAESSGRGGDVADDLDLDLPPHSLKTVRVTSKHGRTTNIGFEEGNDFVDMEVTGLITSGEGESSSSDSASSSENDVSSNEDDKVYFSSKSMSGDVQSDWDSEPVDETKVVKRKRKRKESAKERKLRSRLESMQKMRRFMVKKGLIDSDMSEGELEDFLEQESEDSASGEVVAAQTTPQKKRSKTKKRRTVEDSETDDADRQDRHSRKRSHRSRSKSRRGHQRSRPPEPEE